MRKLGSEHTVAFFSPPEVHRSLLESMKYSSTNAPSSYDVVSWCVNNTCQQMERQRAAWLHQGLDYIRTEQLLDELTEHNPVTVHPSVRSNFWEQLQEPEHRRLLEMYGKEASQVQRTQEQLRNAEHHPFHAALHAAWETDHSLFVTEQDLNEEAENAHEKELAPEKNRQQEVVTPTLPKAYAHAIRPAVLNYFKTGEMGDNKDERDLAFMQAFCSLKMTSAAALLGKTKITKLFGRLHVTRDFVNTVYLSEDLCTDLYLRPVRWVLSNVTTGDIVIVSPYEANEVIPFLARKPHLRLHLYHPRITKAMTDFSGLRYWVMTIGPSKVWPSAETLIGLELFAGRLYFKDKSAYETTCEYLGIFVGKLPDMYEGIVEVQKDGFVSPNSRKRMRWGLQCPFEESPLPFLKAFLSLRTNGQSFSHTHMGFLLDGKPLTEADFEIAERGESSEIVEMGS